MDDGSSKGQLEAKLWTEYELIAGVDEVGRGCIAGPVYGGCAVLDPNKLAALPEVDKALLRDSKTLSAKQRAEALAVIAKVAIAAEVGHGSVREIEDQGIVGGTFLAMTRAYQAVIASLAGGGQKTILLVDGNRKIPAELLPDGLPQMAIVRGDSACFAIAAASIIAKEARDAYMIAASDDYPAYGFASHVGYGTKAHREALVREGYCPLHRRNFAPIRDMVTAAEG